MTVLIQFIVLILILGLIVGLLLWLIDLLPIAPPPFKQFAKAAVIVLAILVLLAKGLPLVGIALP
jgi:hypothetical protein